MEEPVVPTLDGEIRCALRALREPIHLFGETMIERRGRLRKYMIEGNYHTVAAIIAGTNGFGGGGELGEPRATEVKLKKLRETDVLSRGPPHLKEFRTLLAQKSMIRAAHRLQQLKQAFVAASSTANINHDERQPFVSSGSGRRFANSLSVRNVMVAEDSSRPDQGVCAKFSSCAASPISPAVFATGSSIGVVTLWKGERALGSVKLHVSGGYGQVQGLAMHPSRALAFAAARHNKQHVSVIDYSTVLGDQVDGSGACQLGLDDAATLRTSHAAAIKDLAVDPSGSLLATASEDTTLSLWDVERSSLLYVQDGHDESTGATRVAFHPDGSLLLSCDESGTLLGWDVRVGSLAFAVPAAHRFGCWSLASSPCGVLFASGGGDNFVHIWDMRKLAANRTVPAPVLTIAAHLDIVTSLSFTNTLVPNSVMADTLVTTSLDGTGKLWNARDLKCLQTLPKHGGGLRGHCWVSTTTNNNGLPLDDDGEVKGGRLQQALVTVARDYYFRSWLPVKQASWESGAEVSSSSTKVVETKSTLVVASVQGSMKNDAPAPAIHYDDDDDEDEMELLRKRKQVKQEQPIVAPAAVNAMVKEDGDDDDEDEMALLRRKK